MANESPDLLLTEEEIKEILEKYPIKLKHLSVIVDNIYKKYNLTNKSDVSLIVKECLSIIRETLINNQPVSVGKVFNKTVLVKSKKKSFINNPICVKTRTAKKIKNVKYISY